MRILKLLCLPLFAFGVSCSFASPAQGQEKPVDEKKVEKPAAKKTEAKKADTKKKVVGKSPEYISYADLMTPKASFQYWLDTITTNDKAFRTLLIAEFKGFHEADDERIAKAEKYVKGLENEGLRKERVRRLKMCFDYDERLDRENGESAKILANLTEKKRRLWRAQRLNEKKRLIDTHLSMEVRTKFAARKIAALKECTKPDYTKGTSTVLIQLKNSVTDDVESYIVYMKLYTKGLMWRWHRSRKLPFKDETGRWIKNPSDMEGAIKPVAETPKKATAAVEKIDGELKKLREELARVAKEDLTREEKRAELNRKIRAAELRKSEAARELQPYGTPRATWATVRNAYEKANWETFLASHTKDIRDSVAKNDEAKKRFMAASKKKVLRSPSNLRVIVDPDDATKATLKVVISMATVRKTPAGNKGEVTKKDIDSKRLKKKHLALKLQKEKGKWLVASGL